MLPGKAEAKKTLWQTTRYYEIMLLLLGFGCLVFTLNRYQRRSTKLDEDISSNELLCKKEEKQSRINI